jgi:protein disulfide-isomerase A1
MTKQSLPAVSTLENGDSLKDFKESDSVVLVAYFDADDKESNTTFSEAANAMRDNYLFGATNDAELAKEDGVKQPAIVLYKSFDEGKVVFSEKFEKEAIEAFAKKASTPLVGEVGPDTYQGYMSVSDRISYGQPVI